MLLLDFDGVVADALQECAAVTWHAGPFGRGANAPRLPRAAIEVPADFVALFRQVRSYSRTLDDFMVANVLYGQVGCVDRLAFEAARDGNRELLRRQAELAETVRSHWRMHDYDSWLALHALFGEIMSLIDQTSAEITIISAKDADSIRAILDHHHLAAKVNGIEGSCRDKRVAIGKLLQHADPTAGRPVYIDDSIDNIIEVLDMPLEAKWAGWGYHGPEDMVAASERGISMFQLGDVAALSDRHRSVSTE